MEHAINSIIEIHNNKYLVKEDIDNLNCNGCAFRYTGPCLGGECSAKKRSDKKNIIYEYKTSNSI